MKAHSSHELKLNVSWQLLIDIEFAIASEKSRKYLHVHFANRRAANPKRERRETSNVVPHAASVTFAAVCAHVWHSFLLTISSILCLRLILNEASPQTSAKLDFHANELLTFITTSSTRSQSLLQFQSATPKYIVNRFSSSSSLSPSPSLSEFFFDRKFTAIYFQSVNARKQSSWKSFFSVFENFFVCEFFCFLFRRWLEVEP